MDRRKFGTKFFTLVASSTFIGAWLKKATAQSSGYDPSKHYYGMGIQINKCIGCGRCADACKDENNVPKEPFFFRTWVERYLIKKDGDVTVQNIDKRINNTSENVTEKDILRSFFVPKLCNQCDNPPCVQVCPVGATFKTEDGVIIVDEDRCIGCRYCIQACPYGARYLHPENQTADKCTFCYHRITKDLLPACVEVCPTQARIFGDLRSSTSPLGRFKRLNKLHVLKPFLNTEPKVSYSDLDGEVR
ncbi:MAG: 4Fe-4S dicluster domain-containing protein [Ignavibacteriales bacterium]|nr:4Fe-4S dicluster domain-containing protein [Ignavibacteriales bacterium]